MSNDDVGQSYGGAHTAVGGYSSCSHGDVQCDGCQSGVMFDPQATCKFGHPGSSKFGHNGKFGHTGGQIGHGHLHGGRGMSSVGDGGQDGGVAVRSFQFVPYGGGSMQRQYGGSVSQAHSGAPDDDDNSSVQSLRFYGVNVSSDSVKSCQSSRMKHGGSVKKSYHRDGSMKEQSSFGDHFGGKNGRKKYRRCYGCRRKGHLVAKCPDAAERQSVRQEQQPTRRQTTAGLHQFAGPSKPGRRDEARRNRCGGKQQRQQQQQQQQRHQRQSNAGGRGPRGGRGHPRRGRTSTGQIICYGCAGTGHIVANCPEAAADVINSGVEDLQQLSGLVFCVGCSRADHTVANCPYAVAVVDVNSEAEVAAEPVFEAAAAESVEAVPEPVVAAEPVIEAVAAEPVVETVAVEAAPAEVAAEPVIEAAAAEPVEAVPEPAVEAATIEPEAVSVAEKMEAATGEDMDCSQEWMQAMIQDMARDLDKWPDEENAMGAWALPPGNMFEDCPVFD